MYRTIHEGFSQEWLNPIMIAITQTGLGHVQFIGLILLALPRGRRWLIPAFLAFLVLVGLSVPAWRGPVWVQTIDNGLLLLLLIGTAISLSRLEPQRWVALPLAAGLLSGILRIGIVREMDRMRPSNFDFAEPLEHVYANTSFPSGHATTSFAIAFTMLFMTRGSALGWIALVWAVLIGFSRIYVGIHWPTDILGGAAMGLACSALVLLVAGRKEDREAL